MPPQNPDVINNIFMDFATKIISAPHTALRYLNALERTDLAGLFEKFGALPIGTTSSYQLGQQLQMPESPAVRGQSITVNDVILRATQGVSNTFYIAGDPYLKFIQHANDLFDKQLSAAIRTLPNSVGVFSSESLTIKSLIYEMGAFPQYVYDEIMLCFSDSADPRRILTKSFKRQVSTIACAGLIIQLASHADDVMSEKLMLQADQLVGTTMLSPFGILGCCRQFGLGDEKK